MSLHRHSLQAWNRFEPFVSKIVQNYPQPSILDPYPLSPETFVGRCRDAIHGKVKFNHESSLDNPTLTNIFHCLNHGGDFYFSHDGSMVYVGPRRRVLLPDPRTVQPTNPTLSSGKGRLDAKDTEVFRAYALLKHLEHISSPVLFVNISREQMVMLEDEFPNTELIEEKDHWVMI